MSASQFTIYMLDSDTTLNFDSYVYDIVNTFNVEIDDESEMYLLQTSDKSFFKNTQNYKIYTREAKTTPDWAKVLSNVISDLNNIENINHSFVIFIEVNQRIFAVTGGSGHHLIDSVKKQYFGLDLLSRIMDKNDNFIKKVHTRFITGNKLSGETQFINNVNIILEQNLDNIFKHIQSNLPINIIRRKFGLNVTINKKTYSFTTKDSIKLGKSLTINDLDTLLLNISNIMDEEPDYKILPFRFLNKKEPLVAKLDIEMSKQFIDYKDNEFQKENLMILPFHDVCENYCAKNIPAPQSKIFYSEESELLDIFNNFLTVDIDPEEMLNILTNVKLSGITENSTIYTRSFYKHIDAKIVYEDKHYWLTNGEWCLLEQEFIESLNNTYDEKVNELYDANNPTDILYAWDKGSEGDFNFKHNTIPNVYVLDKILVKYIEVCDLLIKEENHLYFVHVKDKIDGNSRVLSNQIMHAMQVLTQVFEHDSSELKNYYHSIKQKIYDDTSEGESTISFAARKFINDFPTFIDFNNFINDMKGKITFVFAVRPTANQDLTNSSTIQSTAAKLSITHLIDQIQSTNFKLKFIEIDRSSPASQRDLTDKELITQ